MPRGFLVKRTNRAAPVSYRVRGADLGPGSAEGPALHWGPPAPAGSPRAPSRSPDRPSGGQPGSAGRPASSSSPVLAESFPDPSALASSLGGGIFVASVSDEEVEMGSSCAPTQAAKRQLTETKVKAHGKRSRADRKAYHDDVTTSPVLGLRITKELADCGQPKAPGQPLGEFICQLCKEQYADALSLAQHRCSRIVRVEYRCAECDKVFSCPANLASHCRWHKPRNPETAKGGGNNRPRAEGQREGCGPCDDPGPGGCAFDCSLCGKKFRRRASLRKHVAAHRPPVLLPGSPKLLRLAFAEAQPGPEAPYGPARTSAGGSFRRAGKLCCSSWQRCTRGSELPTPPANSHVLLGALIPHESALALAAVQVSRTD